MLQLTNATVESRRWVEVLAGDLTLNLLDGFVIQDGSMFTFLEGNSVTGTLANVTPNGADGWMASVIYGSDSASVLFTSVPDLRLLV